MQKATVRSMQQSKMKVVKAVGTSQTTVQPTMHMDLKFQTYRLVVVHSPLRTQIPVSHFSSSYWS